MEGQLPIGVSAYDAGRPRRVVSSPAMRLFQPSQTALLFCGLFAVRNGMIPSRHTARLSPRSVTPGTRSCRDFSKKNRYARCHGKNSSELCVQEIGSGAFLYGNGRFRVVVRPGEVIAPLVRSNRSVAVELIARGDAEERRDMR